MQTCMQHISKMAVRWAASNGRREEYMWLMNLHCRFKKKCCVNVSCFIGVFQNRVVCIIWFLLFSLLINHKHLKRWITWKCNICICGKRACFWSLKKGSIYSYQNHVNIRNIPHFSGRKKNNKLDCKMYFSL